MKTIAFDKLEEKRLIKRLFRKPIKNKEARDGFVKDYRKTFRKLLKN